MAIGMHLVSWLRDDVDLECLFLCSVTGEKGRTKKYAGKIEIGNCVTGYFELIEKTSEETVYSAIVYSKFLKKNIRMVYVTYTGKKRKINMQIVFLHQYTNGCT